LLTYIGWTLTGLSLLAIIAQVIIYFIQPNIPHGIPTIIVLILFFGGLQMLGISILGEYQAKIIEEIKKRPKFIRKNIFKKTQ
jgi:dolichol-phosphate mannosyltransferase